MEARDFRLGNVIYLYDSLHSVKLATLENLACNPKHHYKPVPLTKEWLLKFGLEEMDGWDDQIYYCCPENQEFQVMLCYRGYEYDYTILKYVHQLQNLYFALTGTELSLAKNKTETDNNTESKS